jgi:hypothetical protein
MPKSSTVVKAHRYNETRWELDIRFPTGEWYRYLDVPPETVAAMEGDDSMGQYFNRHIRNDFRCIRLASA